MNQDIELTADEEIRDLPRTFKSKIEDKNSSLPKAKGGPRKLRKPTTPAGKLAHEILLRKKENRYGAFLFKFVRPANFERRNFIRLVECRGLKNKIDFVIRFGGFDETRRNMLFVTVYSPEEQEQAKIAIHERSMERQVEKLRKRTVDDLDTYDDEE